MRKLNKLKYAKELAGSVVLLDKDFKPKDWGILDDDCYRVDGFCVAIVDENIGNRGNVDFFNTPFYPVYVLSTRRFADTPIASCPIDDGESAYSAKEVTSLEQLNEIKEQLDDETKLEQLNEIKEQLDDETKFRGLDSQPALEIIEKHEKKLKEENRVAEQLCTLLN